MTGGFAFNSETFLEEGEPVIRIGDIAQDGSISTEGCKCVSTAVAKKYINFSVHTGEIVLAMTGATIGKAGRYHRELPCLINQRVGVFKHRDQHFDSNFLWYLLASSGYQEYIQLTAFGGAQPNISDAGMVGYFAAIPPAEEQRLIIELLDQETDKLGKLTTKVIDTITLLYEWRTALISAAVTGKIDVRQWQPPEHATDPKN